MTPASQRSAYAKARSRAAAGLIAERSCSGPCSGGEQLTLSVEERKSPAGRVGARPLRLHAPSFLDVGHSAQIRREGACNDSVRDMLGHAMVAVVILVKPVT